MKFGFDIDDTLINLRGHAFSIYQQKLEQEVPVERLDDFKRLEIHELFGLNEEEGRQMWMDHVEEIFFTNCSPFKGSLEVLNELAEKGHEIYYITARFKEFGERTKEWMKEQGFPVQDDHFYYGMNDDEKLHIIQELDLDYYVDDKPAVLDTLSDLRTSVYVRDQAYNRHLELPRVTDWYEFKRELGL
ncbi:nucleotidase [Pontibacillus halophilus JSM 076056 = DSM 19796]|uniref:Nucleotidase n=1 Tax=Pontibacillus halophilus JSM 076056 = DSM 19796 TaxID=1385510 RepID=A0A0A5I283_9BACI|nr:HAD hydrolase-like protein [Pontibacillus halophilus]KGX89952.1 nucleotidase [Pontibacillus halophilus JSM 076056 = DSM 19796]